MSEAVFKLRHVSNNSLHCKSERESKQSIISSCRICLSGILDPATLTTCGHKFCENCLDQYWQAEEKPGFIVCPLCRTNAFKVDFTKKNEIKSTRDFRKFFEPGFLNISDDSFIASTPFCLKISIIVPVMYFILQLLKQPMIDLFNFFSDMYLSVSSMV